MAAGKPPSSRSRKSKAEIQNAFEKIEAQVEANKVELDSKTEESAKIRESEVREAVSEISVESVVQKTGNLGVEISKLLSDVSQRLMTGTGLLTSLREAVAMEKRELERLHQIDVAKTAVDLLVEEYNQQRIAFEKETLGKRTQWETEQENREREAKEFEEGLKKQRSREREEYEYQKTLERKKAENEYEESQRVESRKNKEKQESLEKSWALREMVLKEREEEFTRFKKENAEFPEKLKTEVEKQVGDALKATQATHHQEVLLLKKEFESEKKVAELKIKSLEETLNRQYAQIESLSSRLDEAKQQVQDIAIKAIEGASGARALSHVNQIAMEQAKPRNPQRET